MSPIEAAATLFGLINVTLVVRRSMWNYPFALLMVLLYAWIFFHQKLYSDALLQLFYVVVNLYGWWNWSRSRADTGEVRVEQLDNAARLRWLAGCIAASAAWGALMHRYTDAAFPWWDGGIAMFSIAAQILQSRRNWESWVLWIAVDLAAVPLFAIKGLWLTAGLYLVFLALSVWGLIHWTKAKA
ncbi:nicotinamide riboside transporter PnuC [Sphingomonas psychrotolerans]|uniref:Nicotinamide riboside transporter PnuC n=1 Tax=Sphingomonas psychrotolerans TaxID=1327635 RepID=A0A2K8MLE1_9SPHN|nr:nicotinamide riboside transporter PnuC [Sphingomonas psychrotolerans]ATY32011.1 nicotinamide mononucleotide transporter [Sphingomonas psychrotolerans]